MQIIQQTQIEASQLIRPDRQTNKAHDLKTLSDSQLYGLCKEYGKSARKWTREFGFLLPEVYRRKLYRKYRCTSIYMFAAKLAGMNYDVTNRILNLSEKLKDMSLLWQEFRRFGWTKLAAVAGVAVSETEKFWLDKLRKMPKAALIEYVRQWRSINNKNSDEIGPKNNLFDLVPYENRENDNLSLNKPQSSGTLKLGNKITDRNVAANFRNGEMSDFQKSEARSTFKKLKFRIDPETEFEFKQFKQKMEKERKIELTMGETLKALLKKVKELEPELENREYKSEKFAKATKIPLANQKISHEGKPSRHIPSAQKRSIINHYNGKCAFPGCNEPYFELHHPDRFSIYQSHEKIYPLCRTHHQAAHAGLIKNDDKPVEQWELDFEINSNDLENIIDPKDLNSIYVAYEKFRKNFTDARVREYFDG